MKEKKEKKVETAAVRHYEIKAEPKEVEEEKPGWEKNPRGGWTKLPRNTKNCCD